MAMVWRSQCAFARVFAGKTKQILNNSTDFGVKLSPKLLSILQLNKNYSSYRTSPLVEKVNEYYDFEVVKDPPEWKFVENLLPFETVPSVKPKDNYPSGWIPPKIEAQNLPFFICRTKNHELPIYLDLKERGQRKTTHIKRIDGDIWLMNDEIKEYLKKKYNKFINTRVHELGRFIDVKGDYVNDLKDWAHSKGF